MNLKQLKYVLVLSQEGSFSRAAEVLHISQPSLSQYIKNIEREVGAPLFVREGGEVRLTDAGRVYTDVAEQIVGLEKQMEVRLGELSSYEGGTVTVGISPYRSVHLMPRVLAEFDRLYPRMRLVVRECSGGDLLEGATRGEFDLCVIALPVDDTKFEIEPIQREEVLIAVRRDTPLCEELSRSATEREGKRCPAVDLGRVEGQSFAMLREGMLMRQVTDGLLQRWGVTVREKIEVSSNEALLSVVRSGVCASFIPSGLLDGSVSDVAFFSIEQDAAFRDVAVIYRKHGYLSRPARDLIAIFKGLK
ncbi:MAG: LysR family transcriptional regulator [Clostridia bacterium]|nr:LysR family transcriptional regulator [Clostridia bacterium]